MSDAIPTTGGDPKTIQVRKASYWYDDVIGINDLSVDIGPGVTGLLGPNGAGKSTLMKVISGQLSPRTGEVRINERPLAGNPEVFADVGFVPEFDAFWRGMSGREFVVYLTRLHGFETSEAESAADRAIERVGLTDDADRAVAEYSKGMRQRIKVAQALAHEPSCLLLDEPLNGTDPVGRRHIIDLIRELGAAGTTVVVSSHVLHEIEQMTDEVILIHSGRVLADGHIQEIRDLIDEHPHTIHVDCDRPRELAAELVGFDDVVRLELADDHVRVATRDPAACYDRIPRLTLQHDFGFQGMTSPDNDLDAVFQYLVD
jgi:ABC-2 type transport system ATP-binding protein